MRVPKEQLEFLKKNIIQFAPDAKVYLFGSRVDDRKRGGDIDILILSSKLLELEQKIKIKVAFDSKFGEQKIDLVDFTFNDPSPFKKLVLLEAVEI